VNATEILENDALAVFRRARELVAGLPGKGKRVRVIRNPKPVEVPPQEVPVESPSGPVKTPEPVPA
jgi:hypothetical protein